MIKKIKEAILPTPHKKKCPVCKAGGSHNGSRVAPVIDINRKKQ